MTYFSNWIILYPIAVSLFIGLRLAAASRDEAHRTTASLILRLIMFSFFLLAFLSVGLRASALSIVWILILLIFSAVMYFKNRRLERSAILYTLLNAQTHGQRQMIAEAFFENNLGYIRRRARALRWQFANSIHWGTSLEASRIAVSVYERLGVRLQAKYGKRADFGAPQPIEQREPLVIEQELERTLGRMAMFSWTIIIFPIFAFFLTYIAPTFQSIFAEFGMQLPANMELVISVSRDVSLFAWPSLLPMVPLLFVFAMGSALLLWFFPALTRLPGIRWLFNDYYHSLGLVAFQNASQRELDLTQACRATSQLVPVDFVAARYLVAANLLEQGQLASSAFRLAGILNRREISTLALGLDSSDPIWGLQQLAAWKTERMLQRVSTVVQWLIVGVTLSIGVLIGTLAAGVMQTLSMMILQLDSLES